MASPNFVRIDFDGSDARLGAAEATPDGRRKLRFRHKDLRDVVTDTGKSVTELLQDPFGGWAHLIQYGLRWGDLKINLDKASELIDLWVETHSHEDQPLSSLGDKLLEALNASGFIKIKAEGQDEKPAGPEGNG